MTSGEFGFMLHFDCLVYLSFLKGKTAETRFCLSQTGQGLGKRSHGQWPEVEPCQSHHGGHLPVRWQHLCPAGHRLREGLCHPPILCCCHIWWVAALEGTQNVGHRRADADWEVYKHRLLVSGGGLLKFFTERKGLNSVILRKCIAME